MKLTLSILIGSSLFFFALTTENIKAKGDRSTLIDAEYTKMLLGFDNDLDWKLLGSNDVPIEQYREPILEMIDRLRRFVPESFLEKGVDHTLASEKSGSTFAALTERQETYRGKALSLHGHVVQVRSFPLTPTEQERLGIPELHRCQFQLGPNEQAEVLTAFVPASWKRNEPIRERTALIGLYIKSVERETGNGRQEAGGGWQETGDGVGGDWGPFFVTSKIQWFPDTFLGDLGMDVGCLEQVPPLKVSDIKKKTIEVVPSLRLLNRNEIIRRAFRFTDADRVPFYGLLRTVGTVEPGRIEQEGRKEALKKNRRFASVVELFNEPEKNRGKPVLLHGIAKRVVKTEVQDEKIHAVYGIDMYYQIYLYTDDSGGHPVVVCVRSLPPGMPIGSEHDYAERMSIGAFPYKLWIYETSMSVSDTPDKVAMRGPNGFAPGYTPLLVGREPVWFPREHSSPIFGTKIGTIRSMTVFILLLLVWLFFRRFRTQRPIRFRIA